MMKRPVIGPTLKEEGVRVRKDKEMEKMEEERRKRCINWLMQELSASGT